MKPVARKQIFQNPSHQHFEENPNIQSIEVQRLS